MSFDYSLGVYITTHITEPEYSHHRHGPVMMANELKFFNDNVIAGYRDIYSGLSIPPYIYVCDTGSTAIGFKEVIDEHWIRHLMIPNRCGAFAALKFVMQTEPERMDDHDYYLFHVDDGTRIVKNDWATELIIKYKNINNLGVMGRLAETIRLGPAGLVDHRNVCPQVAMMHDVLWVQEVPHLHADYWFMDKNTLKGLAACWNDPMNSQEAMDYQLKYEQMDFRDVWELDKSRKTLDNIHIGREVDMPMRIKHFLNLDIATFETDKILV